jgi:hypothetical protein
VVRLHEGFASEQVDVAECNGSSSSVNGIVAMKIQGVGARGELVDLNGGIDAAACGHEP